MNPNTIMESSDLDQATPKPRKSTRKRTTSTTDTAASPCSGHAEKKACLTSPAKAQHKYTPPKPTFRIAKQDDISAKLSISLDDVEKWPTYNPLESGKQPLFTTFRETRRKDELVSCEILGFYESMDEANYKVIASWDPAWDKNGGEPTYGTKEDGAIWWQREESVSFAFLFEVAKQISRVLLIGEIEADGLVGWTLDTGSCEQR